MVFVCSCSSVKKVSYCINSEKFDINIINSEIDKINQKLILNTLINESNVEYDKYSNFLIELQIKIRRNNSLISINNTVEIENINFVVSYKIFDKNEKNIIDKGKIIIVDSVHISDDRFANFATENYLMENFARNLSIKLENKIKMLLNNKKCKKNQNEVAIYYFNANINSESTKDSHYV